MGLLRQIMQMVQGLAEVGKILLPCSRKKDFQSSSKQNVIGADFLDVAFIIATQKQFIF